MSRVSRVCPGSPGVFLLVLCVPAPPGGAVAITVITTARLRVSGVVWGDACVPGFGCGLARESVGGVGFEVGL